MIDGLRFETEGPLARITFDRPAKKNALTHRMWAGVPEFVARAAADPAVRVLLLTGAGGDFSAGADIGEFAALRTEPESVLRYDETVAAAVAALSDLDKPSIAVVRGHCVGGGCQLATACDFRIAEAGARFGITPARLGIVYDFRSTRQLVALLGPAAARRLLLTGELIDTARAAAIGLVDEVAAAGELDAVAEAFAGTLAARSQTAVRGMNRIIGRILDGQTEPDDEVRRIRAAAVTDADYAEGVAAFLARRPPVF